jgi:hypothetical protein
VAEPSGLGRVSRVVVEGMVWLWFWLCALVCFVVGVGLDVGYECLLLLCLKSCKVVGLNFVM